MSELPDYVLHNRKMWDKWAAEYVEAGEEQWAAAEPTWGIWNAPERAVGMFPDDLNGKDTIELGCGTGYVSSWLARRGAQAVGIDNSESQLATARRLQKEHGIEFPLHHGNAEEVPHPDESFDFAISEYGACLWADPHRWVPEAARLLRPGGRLSFLTNSFLVVLCSPDLEDSVASDQLQRPAFGVHRMDWSGEGGTEFHLSHGDWIRLLRRNGFQIEDLVEVRPPESATKTRWPFVTLEWSKQWPCEEAWKVRKQ